MDIFSQAMASAEIDEFSNNSNTKAYETLLLKLLLLFRFQLK